MIGTHTQTSATGKGQIARILSWGLVIGAVAQIVLGFGFAAAEQPGSSDHAAATAVNVAQHLLLLGGVYAAAFMGIGGHGRQARFGFPVALSAILVLCVAEVYTLVNMNVANPLFGIASIGMMAGLITAGIGAVQGKLLPGRDRFALLITGAFVSLTIIGVALPGLWLHYMIGLWGVTLLWLGFALVRFNGEYDRGV